MTLKRLDYIELWFFSFLLNFILKSNIPLYLPGPFLSLLLFSFCFGRMHSCLSSISLFVGELVHTSFDFHHIYFHDCFKQLSLAPVVVCFLIIPLSCLLSCRERLFFLQRTSRCFCCILDYEAVQPAHDNACGRASCIWFHTKRLLEIYPLFMTCLQ